MHEKSYFRAVSWVWLAARRASGAHGPCAGNNGADHAIGSGVLDDHGIAHAASAMARPMAVSETPGASNVMVTVWPLVTTTGWRTSVAEMTSPARSGRRLPCLRPHPGCEDIAGHDRVCGRTQHDIAIADHFAAAISRAEVTTAYLKPARDRRKQTECGRGEDRDQRKDREELADHGLALCHLRGLLHHLVAAVITLEFIS